MNGLSSTTMAGLLALVAWSCSGLDPINEGDSLIERGEYAAAETLLTPAIESKELSDRALRLAHLRRGEARLELGSITEAIADAEAALAVYPGTDAYFLRGRGRKLAGDFAAAETDFQRVIQIHQRVQRRSRMQSDRGGLGQTRTFKPSTARIAARSSVALGEIALYRELYEQALAHLDAATVIAPQEPEVYLKRGGAFELMEQYGPAKTDRRRFLELGGDPSLRAVTVMGPLLLKEALAHYAGGRYQSAVDRAGEALTLHPKYIKALMCRAHGHTKLGQPKQALTDLDLVIQEQPKHPQAHLYRSFTLTELGRFEQAEQDADLVLLNDPENSDAMLQRGFARLGRGIYGAADSDFSQVLNSDPHHQRALLYRGIARYRSGRLDNAKKDFQAVIRHAPTHPKAHYLLGLTHYGKQDYQDALKLLTRAMELDPGNGKIFYLRGMARFQAGLKQAALADLDQAIRLQPENGRYHFSRGVARSSLRQPRAASEDFIRARELLARESEDPSGSAGALEPETDPLQPATGE